MSARLSSARSCVLVAREWVSDDSVSDCMACKQRACARLRCRPAMPPHSVSRTTAFTFTRRRHHCRNCFGVFCDTCTQKKVAILKLGRTEPERVCDQCYGKLTRVK